MLSCRPPRELRFPARPPSATELAELSHAAVACATALALALAAAAAARGLFNGESERGAARYWALGVSRRLLALWFSCPPLTFPSDDCGFSGGTCRRLSFNPSEADSVSGSGHDCGRPVLVTESSGCGGRSSLRCRLGDTRGGPLPA